MTRPPRLEIADGVYHVTSRGNAGMAIYRTDDDRRLHLGVLAHAVVRYGWICLAYCQMRNHYHFLVRTPTPNLALGMRQLNGVYAQAFNARHSRYGHLFQGRYKAFLVETEPHALDAAAYIFRNPVDAGLCGAAEDWPWSSYRATLGMTTVPSFVDTDALLRLFGTRKDAARTALRELVERRPAAAAPEPTPVGSILLGSDEFVVQHAALIEPLPEIPRNGWQPDRPPLETVLAGDAGDPAALLHAYRAYGYRLREIADHLGVHYSTVSRHLRRAEVEEGLLQRKT